MTLSRKRKSDVLMLYENGVEVNGSLVKLPLKGKAIVIGDLHGRVKVLEEILKKTNFEERIKNGENLYLIFLGDYGDRPEREEDSSLEVLKKVAVLKATHPQNVILLKGNHEHVVNGKISIQPHNLPSELEKTFGSEWEKHYDKIKEVFKNLPLAVKTGNGIILMHGGPATSVKNWNDYENPSEETILQTVWNEHDKNSDGFKKSYRGEGVYQVGEKATRDFLEKLDLKAMIVGHNHKNESFWNAAFSVNSNDINGSTPSWLEINLEKKINGKPEEVIKRHFIGEESEAGEKPVGKEEPVFNIQTFIINGASKIPQREHVLTWKKLIEGVTLGRFSHTIPNLPVTGEGVEDHFKVGNISRNQVELKLENGLLSIEHKASTTPTVVLLKKGPDIKLEKNGVNKCFVNLSNLKGLILGEGKNTVKVDFNTPSEKKEEDAALDFKSVAETHKKLTKKPF